MARPRSPNRDKAYQLWLESGKTRQLKDIADELNVSEEQVRKWKNQDQWDKVTLPNANSNVTKPKKNQSKPKEEPVVEAVESVLENPELTEKQRLFCLHFIKCFNATKAYQKAYGCDYYTAKAHGFELLQSVAIKNQIKLLKRMKLNQVFLEGEDIVQKYIDIAFSDITDYLSFGREMVPVMGAFGPVEVKDEETGKKVPLMQEVNTVKFRESTEADGTLISEVKQGKSGASIKLADRMKALDWLANYFELNPADNHKREYDKRKLEMELLKMEREQASQTAQEATEDNFLDTLKQSAKAVWDDYNME